MVKISSIQWRQFLWGWGGGQLPPHVFKESTKSQTFLSLFTLELLWITQKSHADLVSAPPLFLENDAPVMVGSELGAVQSLGPEIDSSLWFHTSSSCGIAVLDECMDEGI